MCSETDCHPENAIDFCNCYHFVQSFMYAFFMHFEKEFQYYFSSYKQMLNQTRFKMDFSVPKLYLYIKLFLQYIYNIYFTYTF